MNYSREFKIGVVAGKLEDLYEKEDMEMNEILDYINEIKHNDITFSQDELFGILSYGIGPCEIMWYMGREPVIVRYADYEAADDYDDDGNEEISVICRDSLGDKWICDSVMIKNLHEEEEFGEDTIITNIKCNKCNNVLPPHSIKEHVDKECNIHKCPHTL